MMRKTKSGPSRVLEFKVGETGVSPTPGVWEQVLRIEGHGRLYFVNPTLLLEGQGLELMD